MVGCDLAGLGITPDFSWMSCKPKHGIAKETWSFEMSKLNFLSQMLGCWLPFP
ncbi:hypothetical protein ACRRTK_016946 [Alexandromys fortis]